MDNPSTQFGKAQNPTGDSKENTKSTNALLASIMALLSQSGGATGTPPDASKLKMDPSMGTSGLINTGSMGKALPPGFDAEQALEGKTPDAYGNTFFGANLDHIHPGMNVSPTGTRDAQGQPLTLGPLSPEAIGFRSSQQAAQMNQMAGAFQTLLQQLGPSLTDHPSNQNSTLTGTPNAPPSAATQPVYEPYNPAPSMPLAAPSPAPVVPMPANPVAANVPAVVPANAPAPVPKAAVQADSFSPQSSAAPSAPVSAPNSYAPPSAASLPQMPQQIQAPSFGSGGFGSGMGGSNPGAMQSLGQLPSSADTMGAAANSFVSTPDPGMGDLTSGVYQSGGGPTVGSSMGGGGMSAGAIGGVTSGIMGIGKGIGDMFKGVQLQIPQPGALPPLSQFKPPTMY